MTAKQKPKTKDSQLLLVPESEEAAGRQHHQEDKADRQEIFLPVTGFVWLHPEEMAVVDHPAFQRLGRICQLGQAYYVYRGATHKRLEHCLGAIHIVERMADAVERNYDKARHRKTLRPPDLNREERRFVRLGALLHDIGHVAAGHTLEDELGLLDKHDADGRIDTVFGKRFLDEQNRTLGDLIDTEFDKFIPQSLKDKEITAATIIRLLIRKKPRGQDKFERESLILKESNDIRWNVCSNMIGNTICADLLDYLHRDWYHVGKPRPFDDRILQYMEIRNHSKSGETPKPAEPSANLKASKDDQFVISLGRRPKIRTDAISAILELLEWRYQLAESVLFHRTKLSAAAMLDRAMYELWKDTQSDAIENQIIELSDEELLTTCARLAMDGGKLVAADLFEKLRLRRLYEDFRTVTADQVPASDRKRIGTHYSEGSKESTARNRNLALRILENDFSLPSGSLVMYCASEKMNAKIAEVQIAVNDYINEFSKYEDEFDNQLSGGHLAAQLKRFRDLWRVHFFIDSGVKAGLSSEMQYLLRLAIERLVLRLTDEQPSVTAQALARQFVSIPGHELSGHVVTEEALVGAYGDSANVGGVYPSGMESIRRYVRKN